MGPTFIMNGQQVDSLPGFGERVQLDPKIQAGLLEFIDRNKSDPEYQKFVAGDGIAKPGDEEPESSFENLSPAARRLRKLRNNKPAVERTVKVHVDDEEWFVLRMNIGELTRLGLYTPRDRDGNLNFADANALTAITAAMMFCALVVDIDDDTPMFDSFGEALEWAESYDTGVMKVVTQLFEHIQTLNPAILPDSEPEKKVSPPSNVNTSSVNARENGAKPNISLVGEAPPNSTPADGIATTQPSDAPATSPAD